MYAEAQCEDLGNNTFRFINSALSHEKNCIMLDKVFTDDSNLLMESEDVKKKVMRHFQTVAELPIVDPIMLLSSSPIWSAQYSPKNNIHDCIYDRFLQDPSKEE